MVLKKGYLALESGKVFEGISFGSEKEAYGEVIFNTSMVGYQEIITDPSSYGHITCFTQPHIGNCGCNKDSNESEKVHSRGIIVKENSTVVSNSFSEFTLQDLLIKNDIPALEGIDTRELTKHIRDNGSLKAVISFLGDYPSKLVEKAKSIDTDNTKYIQEVSSKEKHIYCQGNSGIIGVIDYGCKNSLLRSIASKGYKIIIFPYNTSAKEISASGIDGLFLSSGPGNTQKELSNTIKTIIETNPDLPVFGVSIGFQIMAEAFGGKFTKHKFGRHGSNQPVKNLENNRVEITSQSNGYTLDNSFKNNNDLIITHINLFDSSIQGFKHKKYPVFGVQYCPSADISETSYLFETFFRMVNKNA